MFYSFQPVEYKDNYKKMLAKLGSLSSIFSESSNPYLPYRAHENIFCKYFDAENLARYDCSIDAKKDNIGIGLKTWVGSDDQKIAEFGKLRDSYKNLSGLELAKRISFLRNERIRVTRNLHNINTMLYHIVKRTPKKMNIFEYTFDEIDIDNVVLLPNRGNSNNTYFSDGKNIYHFSSSKNTLYMLFSNALFLDEIEIDIVEDPYNCLLSLSNNNSQTIAYVAEEKSEYDIEEIVKAPDKLKSICLRLYSTDKHGNKVVYPNSGLNQWNAKGRPRNPNEIYIPYPVVDREISKEFFPPRNQSFNLSLPDGSKIQAKVCQADGKAIMSNPNKVLGQWLLRDVFEILEGTIVTYEMLELFGIDSVVIAKLNDSDYKINFANIGTYESYFEEMEV